MRKKVAWLLGVAMVLGLVSVAQARGRGPGQLEQRLERAKTLATASAERAADRFDAISSRTIAQVDALMALGQVERAQWVAAGGARQIRRTEWVTLRLITRFCEQAARQADRRDATETAAELRAYAQTLADQVRDDAQYAIDSIYYALDGAGGPGDDDWPDVPAE